MLGRRNRLKPKILRLIRLIHIGDVVGTASARLEINALNFSNAAKLYSQAQAHKQRRACLAHRAHVTHLPILRIGKYVRVIAAPFGCFPETISQFKDLIVLCISDPFGKG